MEYSKPKNNVDLLKSHIAYHIMFREVRTTQERRANQGNSKLWRSKRNFKNMPEAYDDLPISRCDMKSWKDRTKRRKQYKTKDIQ